jgi:hypothetical protein
MRIAHPITACSLMCGQLLASCFWVRAAFQLHVHIVTAPKLQVIVTELHHHCNRDEHIEVKV